MRIGFVLLLALCGFWARVTTAADHSAPAALPPDSILAEYYEEIGGTVVVNLTETQNYPDFPSTTQYLKLFEIPSNRSDNYGTRLRGYITAPESGAYTFWIAADDCAELYLSTSEDPAAKQKIASADQWTPPRNWDQTPSQKSKPITLEKGKRYYIEALHKEMGGGDCLAVAWQLPSGAKEAPIPGNRLSPCPAPKIVPLTSFPAKLTVTTPPPTSPGYHVLKGTVNWRDKDFPVACGLFLQKEYFVSTQEKFPIITTLHNVVFAIGGSDGNEAIRSEGFAQLMNADIGVDGRQTGEKPAVIFNPRKEVQFIGVIPQCPKGMGFQFMPMSGVVVEWINWVEKNYRGDGDRCYLTGYSYGGSCTWAVATMFPERFAAIAPFSARVGPALERTPEIMKDMGVWCGVGEMDGEFRQACEKMNEFFTTAKHPNFHFTMIKGGGHQCYERIYGNGDFWKWLLAQKRKK